MPSGTPGYSGAIGSMAVMLRKLYGWDYFKALERNRPQIGRSSEDPITLLNAGERTVGLGVPIGTTLLSVSRGNPLTLIYPEDGSILVLSPSGIPKNAPHPNAAKLWQEFAGSLEFSRTTAQYFNLPLADRRAAAARGEAADPDQAGARLASRDRNRRAGSEGGCGATRSVFEARAARGIAAPRVRARGHRAPAQPGNRRFCSGGC